MIPAPVRDWLAEHGHGETVSARPVGGGCINNGAILSTTNGESFFLKTNQSCPQDMFPAEARGLAALTVPGGPCVPRAYLSGRTFLLMDYLAPASARKDYWEEFGRRMAALHNHTAARFGFEEDNYIGSTSQPNPWTEDGYEFYARQRYSYQAELAARQGYLNRDQVRRVSALAQRLPELVPVQPSSLLHGDLWSGNWMTDAKGNPAIIDPAAYYGWAEADLAMMSLFGAPGPGFWKAYLEVRPLEPGFRERFGLYNLYHLLNHLNLFGRSYYAQVIGVLDRYSS